MSRRCTCCPDGHAVLCPVHADEAAELMDLLARMKESR